MNETNINPGASAGGETPAGAQPGQCPDRAVWLTVAAGTEETERTLEHLRHATSCRSCAQELKEALALLTGTESEEEQAALNALPGLTDPGLEALAQHVCTASGKRPGVLEFVPARRRWVLPAFALAAAILLVAIYAGYRVREASLDDRLIAAAYSAERPSELRLPGSAPSALVSPTRGESRPTESAELLELKLRAQRAFARNPNNAGLRQTLGRIALVEHNGESARREFEMAEVLDPKLPRLKLDLGEAYFELAESSGQQLEYARAIEFFSQYLAEVHDADPVALYDRGLCWERQSIYPQAENDFEAALKLEHDPGWRSEIQSHLARVKAAQARSATEAAPRAAFSASALLAARTETPGLYESALAAASRDWLPRRGLTLPQIDAALQRTAELGLAHGDHWLKDMLARSPTAEERAAETALAQAVAATGNGNAEATLDRATDAASRFHRLGNKAGWLRASLEHVYALHQLARPSEALVEIPVLLRNKQLPRYTWLHTALYLEEASDSTMSGETSRSRFYEVSAAHLAQTSNLPLIGLRASMFLLSDELQQGRLEPAWEDATRQIRLSYQLPGVSMRRSQIFTHMAATADQLHLPWTRTAIEAAAAEEASHAGNGTVAAYNYEKLGLDQLNLDDTPAAGASFARADRVLQAIGSNRASTLYRADWQAERSRYEARQYGPEVALQHLARMEPGLRDTSSLYMRVGFYTEMADLLRQTHRIDQSLAAAWTAVRASEQALSNIHTAAQRETWRISSVRAYNILALDFALAGKPELALRTWEWMRTATQRAGGPALPADVSSFETVAPPLPAPSSGQLTLVYAELEGHYVAWAISGDAHPSVVMRSLQAVPEQIAVNGRALLRLCSDPHSSLADIQVLGAALDRALLMPFASEIEQAQTIELDLDPTLAQIPVAAIVHRQQFLGLSHPLLYLPANWTLAGSAQDRLMSPPEILVLHEAPARGKARIPEEYDESIQLQHRFPRTHIEVVSLARDGSTLQVSGSHDLPALLASAEILHYTGHELPEQSAASAQLPASGTSFAVAPASLGHCQLAVLAACRTSVEREETEIDDPSFARILLAAGAARVLATQWDVDSRMTQRLMLRFYTEVASHQTYIESLRRAQKAVASDAMSAHPYFWASFQLVGRPAR